MMSWIATARRTDDSVGVVSGQPTENSYGGFVLFQGQALSGKSPHTWVRILYRLEEQIETLISFNLCRCPTYTPLYLHCLIPEELLQNIDRVLKSPGTSSPQGFNDRCLDHQIITGK